jgi:hypothetical protein
MRSFVGYLIVAIVLVVGGFALWSAALRQQQIAAAERDLAAFQFERAATALDTLATSSSGLTSLVPGLDSTTDATRTGALSAYWQSQYDAVSGDQAFALLAANAAFRALEREGGPMTVVVGKLDAIVKRYADILRDDPNNEDAAYNYEYIVRMRGAIVARKQPVAPVDPATSGRTLHGQAGAPPETTDMKQFKMIVPMLPQERQEAEQAGRGTTRVRKG